LSGCSRGRLLHDFRRSDSRRQHPRVDRRAWRTEAGSVVGGAVRSCCAGAGRLTAPCARQPALVYTVYTNSTLDCGGVMAAKRSPKSDRREKPPQPAVVMETRVFKTGNSYAVRLPRSLYSGGEAPVYVQKL